MLLWSPPGWTAVSIPDENPRGLGALRDGSLLMLDAPAASQGLLRLQHIVGGITGTTQGAIPAGFGALAWVLPGPGAGQASVLSLGNPPALSCIDINVTPVLQRVSTLSGYDAQSAIALPDGGVLFPGGGGLTRFSSSGASATLPLPSDTPAPTLLAPGAGPGFGWPRAGPLSHFLRQSRHQW